MWWVSTRTILRPGDPEWPAYFFNHPFPQVRELRTVDPYFNNYVGEWGSHWFESLDGLAGELAKLPPPVPGRQYYCLSADVADDPPRQTEGALTLLGHDVAEGVGTSSLT